MISRVGTALVLYCPALNFLATSRMNFCAVLYCVRPYMTVLYRTRTVLYCAMLWCAVSFPVLRCIMSIAHPAELI